MDRIVYGAFQQLAYVQKLTCSSKVRYSYRVYRADNQQPDSRIVAPAFSLFVIVFSTYPSNSYLNIKAIDLKNAPSIMHCSNFSYYLITLRSNQTVHNVK